MGGVSAAIAITYLSVVPRQYVRVDHHGATETLRRMRAGQGFYSTLRDTYWFDSGIRLGGPRSIRTPFLFEVLALFAAQWLLPLFVLVVVVGTCVLLADASAHPYAALPVALFLLVAGRWFGAGRMETWMFVELWAVPSSALLLGLEQAPPLGRRPGCRSRGAGPRAGPPGRVLRPGPRARPGPELATVGGRLIVAVLGLTLHLVLALQAGSPNGTEAPLLGSGDPPRTVVDVMSCGLPLGYGLVLWSLAIIHLVRRRLVTPVTPLIALPLLGLFVDRGYWGNLIAPFIVLWVGELVGDVWAERHPKPPPEARATAVVGRSSVQRVEPSAIRPEKPPGAVGSGWCNAPCTSRNSRSMPLARRVGRAAACSIAIDTVSMTAAVAVDLRGQGRRRVLERVVEASGRRLASIIARTVSLALVSRPSIRPTSGATSGRVGPTGGERDGSGGRGLGDADVARHDQRQGGAEHGAPDGVPLVPGG